jgi:hypothetical protein
MCITCEHELWEEHLLEVLHRNMDADVVLTGDDVIKELWPSERRTKRSADVATEMNRLRRSLRTYYHGEGRQRPGYR